MRPRDIKVKPAEWKGQVGIAKGKLDDIYRTLQPETASGEIHDNNTLCESGLSCQLQEADMVGIDFMLIKESFFTYREALDCFSDVLTCNEEIWALYSRNTTLWTCASATSAGASAGGVALVRGAALLGTIPMAWLWAPAVAGVVVCAATAYPAYRNKEKANWCKQGSSPMARMRPQARSKLTGLIFATVDTCLRVCWASVRDCERLTGYLYLHHSRGQESEGAILKEILDEITEKTGKDPRQEDFIENGGYKAFLQDRRGVLKGALDKHEGAFTKIEKMSI